VFDVNNNFEIKEKKMKAISLRKLVIAVVIIVIATGYARADKQQLQARLNRDVEIELTNVTIAQALEVIGKNAEVKIVLSDEAVWKLPSGAATRLSVEMSGSLADSLTEMLNKFFMRYAVGYDKITIYPRQELEHILGKPNTKQLELLKRIYYEKIFFKDLREIDQFTSFTRAYIGDVSFIPYNIPEEMFGIGLAYDSYVTLAALLEQTGLELKIPCWYLSGTDLPGQVPPIKFVNEETFREAKLDQVVDISFKDESADVIIQRLAGWTGMELFVSKGDPSWLKEEIFVNMQNIKLRQALRNIVSSVDGEVDIDFEGNYIEIKGPMGGYKPTAPGKTKSSGGAGEGYVGKISIPMDGGKYFIEFMLRESDLTEELKKLREDKIREILRKVGKTGNNALEIAVRSQPYSMLN